MRDFFRYARSVGLSMVQMTVLMQLYYRGPHEVMALRDLMQVSPAGASQMVDRLAQQGLVQREEVPGDRRVRLVHLTETGRRLVLESIAARNEWVKLLLASIDEDQRVAIGQALCHLTEHAATLEAEGAGWGPAEP